MKKEELVAIINELNDAIMGVQEGGYCPICEIEFTESGTEEHTPECEALYDRIEEAQSDA
jgi:hypothetical protein